jgi:hypothetical protein
MPRAVEKWVGSRHDAKIPDRVRQRVYDDHDGICHACGIHMGGKLWQLDHVIAAKAIISMTTRDDYHHKFVCSQCGETIFVFGQKPQSPVCAICRTLLGWHLLDRSQWPTSFRFSEELQALVALDGIGPISLQCIYLDEEGRSQREP